MPSSFSKIWEIWQDQQGINEGYISATTPCFLPECATQRFNVKTSRLTQEVKKKKKSSQGCWDCAWFYANCLPIQWTITYSLLLGPLCRFKSVSFVPLPTLLHPPSFHLPSPSVRSCMRSLSRQWWKAAEGFRWLKCLHVEASRRSISIIF